MATLHAPKRVLVLGASGMLGHTLIRVMGARHEIFGTTLRNFDTSSPLATLLGQDHWISGIDGRNWTLMETAIRQIRPNIIINCVGKIKQKISAIDVAETIHLNSLLPHQLAQISHTLGIRLIHISTDCVFAGNPGIKKLSDMPDATDLYGVTKRLGEIRNGQSLTLRTSVIGRQLYGSESLIEWVLSQRGRTINGFVNAIYSGLTTLALSKVIQDIIERHESLTGLFQVASNPINKYDLISRVNTCFSLGINVRPDTSFHCDRSLDGSVFLRATNIPIPSWDEMLLELSTDTAFYEFRRS